VGGSPRGDVTEIGSDEAGKASQKLSKVYGVSVYGSE
jgi:hypothetical protein